MNNKELENAKLNDEDLEAVYGGIGNKGYGVDGGAVRRPREEFIKKIGDCTTEYNPVANRIQKK